MFGQEIASRRHALDLKKGLPTSQSVTGGTAIAPESANATAASISAGSGLRCGLLLRQIAGQHASSGRAYLSARQEAPPLAARSAGATAR